MPTTTEQGVRVAEDLVLLMQALDAAPATPAGAAAAAAGVLADRVGDLALVCLLDTEQDQRMCCTTRHRDPGREPELAATVGASQVDDLRTLAEIIDQGLDVRAVLRRETVLAPDGVRTARYLPAADPYVARYGLCDGLPHVMRGPDGELVGLILCGREGASAPYSPLDEERFAVLSQQLTVVLGALHAEAMARRASTRNHQAAERQRQVLHDIVLGGQRTRERVAASLHDDVLQRLVAASLRLELVAGTPQPTETPQGGEVTTPYPDDETALSAVISELRGLAERLRDLMADLAPVPHRPEMHVRPRLAGHPETGPRVGVEGDWTPMVWDRGEAVVHAVQDVIEEMSDDGDVVVRLTEDPDAWHLALFSDETCCPLREGTQVHLDALEAVSHTSAGGFTLSLPKDLAAEPQTDLTRPAQPQRLPDVVTRLDASAASWTGWQGARAIVGLGQDLHRRPFSYAEAATTAAHVLAEAVGDYAALCLFPATRCGDAVVAVHHRDPDRRALLEATLGTARADDLRALSAFIAQGGEERVVDYRDRPMADGQFVPEALPYVRAVGVTDAFWAPVRHGDRLIGLIVCGRDGDGEPFTQGARDWLAVAAEQVRLMVVLGESTARARALERTWRERTAARRALLPRLALVEDLERGRIAEHVGHLVTAELDGVLAGVTGLLRGHDRDPQLDVVVRWLSEARAGLSGIGAALTPQERPEPLEVVLPRLVRDVFGDVAVPRVSVDVESGGELLPPGPHHELTRAVREALVNAHRHAHARHLHLRCTGDVTRGLVLTVTDDGVGLPPSLPRRPRHLGLYSMERRLQSVGGTCEISRSQDGGTTVRFELPGEGART